jgi:hypothetical protein
MIRRIRFLILSAFCLALCTSSLLALEKSNPPEKKPTSKSTSFPFPWLKPKPKPKPQPKIEYLVRLYHPATNGLIYTQTAPTLQDAEKLRTQFETYHWRRWELNGIGEPKRYAGPFARYGLAANYEIPVPPFRFIVEQSVIAGRVTVTPVNKPPAASTSTKP